MYELLFVSKLFEIKIIQDLEIFRGRYFQNYRPKNFVFSRFFDINIRYWKYWEIQIPNWRSQCPFTNPDTIYPYFVRKNILII